MKITQNRTHLLKGRIALVCGWLRLLVDCSIDPLKLEQELPKSGASLRALIACTCNNWHANKGEYDFSHEVKETALGCLACRACSTQCPIKTDMPEFHSRFLQLYHTRYSRPLRNHLVVTVESYASLMARAPKILNFFTSQSLVRKPPERHIGIVDLPLLSVPSLQQQMVGHCLANMTLKQLEALDAGQRVCTALMMQDPFTGYYDTQVMADFVRLVEKLGSQPVLLPFSPSGRARHIKGFLNCFAKMVKKTADFPNRMAKLDIPMVGVNPTLIPCHRDEYRLVLGGERNEFDVLPANERLASALDSQPVATVNGESWYFFSHCIEVTALPDTPAQWAAVFARSGVRPENINVGCCGMAGAYGHEMKNHKDSLEIYELSWRQAMQRLPRNHCPATGYSCRS